MTPPSVTPFVGAPVAAFRLHFTQMWVPSPGDVVPPSLVVAMGRSENVMRFSSVLGWWMAGQIWEGLHGGSALVRSQPAQWMPNAGLGAASSSTSVKSEAALAERKNAPVSNWVSVPSPCPPLAGLPGGRHTEFW
jgi:hypothetical protein